LRGFLVGLALALFGLLLVEGVLAALGLFGAADRVRISIDAGALRAAIERRGRGELAVECPIERAHEGPRVVLIGASTIYGYRVRDRSTIADFLQRELEERSGTQHEVLTLALPSLTAEEVADLVDVALLELAPDLIVVYTGHNEFLPQYRGDLDFAARHPLLGRLRQAAQATRLGRALVSALPPNAPTQANSSDGFHVRAESRVAPARRLVLARYRDALEQIARECSAQQTALVFAAPVSNGLEYPPRQSAHSRALDGDERNAYAARLDDAAQALADGRSQAAGAALSAAEALDPFVAELLHLQARRAWQRGESARGRALDRMKWQYDEQAGAAGTSIWDELGAVCERFGLTLCDASAALEDVPPADAAAHFIDPVHPTSYGQFLLARELATSCLRALGEHTEPARTTTFREACAQLGIADTPLRPPGSVFVSDVARATTTLFPEPLVARAERLLTRIPLKQQTETNLTLATFLLAVLQADRERILECAEHARAWNRAAFESVLGTFDARPNLARGLARAGLECADGALRRIASD